MMQLKSLLGRGGAVICLMLIDLAMAPVACAGDGLWFWRKPAIVKLNQSIQGTVYDFTNNHGQDHRFYSPALDERRDLYVYIPPGYASTQAYPLILYLHGLAQDENNFLEFVPKIDEHIAAGRLPPVIIVAPDGSIQQRRELFLRGSFYVNSKSGSFANYIMHDIWAFVHDNFKIRPEREAHVIMGASMGGFGAYNLGFKHRESFGVIVGIMPPLNLRYGDRQGNPRANYDPDNFALRKITNRQEVLARFYGVVAIRTKQILDPLFGPVFNPQEATEFISRENPYEMLTNLNIRPGEFEMFVGYGTKDEFNIHSECESFLDLAKRREIPIHVVVVPEGRHDLKTAQKMMPELIQWLKPKLEPYSPRRMDPPVMPSQASQKASVMERLRTMWPRPGARKP